MSITDILVIEKPDDRRGIQILQPGQILFTPKKIPAQSDLAVLIARRQKTIMTDPDKPLGRDMHPPIFPSGIPGTWDSTGRDRNYSGRKCSRILHTHSR